MLYLVLDGIAVYSALSLLKSWRDRRRNPSLNLPYPPGPKPLPVIGNLRDLNGNPFLNAVEWSKAYGTFHYFVTLSCFAEPILQGMLCT